LENIELKKKNSNKYAKSYLVPSLYAQIGPNLYLFWQNNHYCCVRQTDNVGVSILGMYRIAIFKIRPEPESTGYQMNYPVGTGTGYQ